MSVKWDNSPQGSPGWFKARQGCLTASRVEDAFSFGRDGKESKARSDLKIELVAERITGTSKENFVTAAMAHGSFWEQYARRYYSEKKGVPVQQVGFGKHPDLQYFGCSPDGLIYEDGLIEIKCPQLPTYFRWLAEEKMPDDYVGQMTAQCAVTGRKWVDFVAFFPSMSELEALDDIGLVAQFGKRVVPERLRMKVWRFEPTVKQVEDCLENAEQFLKEVDDLVFKFDMMGDD